MQTFDNFIIIEEISKELKIPTVEAAEIFEAYFSILNGSFPISLKCANFSRRICSNSFKFSIGNPPISFGIVN